MRAKYCKVECDLGILFIKEYPWITLHDLCTVKFIPSDTLLPTTGFMYDRRYKEIMNPSKLQLDIFNCMGSNICELERIVAETLKWRENWLGVVVE